MKAKATTGAKPLPESHGNPGTAFRPSRRQTLASVPAAVLGGLPATAISRLALLCCCASALVAGIIQPAKADETTFTLYSQAVDGVTDNASPDFPAPGGTFVQASALFTTSDRSGTPVGTIYISCNQLLTQFDAICIAVIKSAKGTDAINVQGYYSEAGELLNNCGPVVQVLGVSGGTGAYNAAQGQVTVTHLPVNPVGPTCAHSVHDFIFTVSLKHPPNGN